MTTRQDYATALMQQLPQAVTAIGADKLAAWAKGTLFSSEREREYTIFQIEGLSQHLKNTVLCYLNLPSVGYSDFSNAKKVQGDQYRGYVARAKAVYDSEVAQLSAMQANNATNAAILIQESVISAALNNFNTWTNTLNNALAAKEVQ